MCALDSEANDAGQPRGEGVRNLPELRLARSGELPVDWEILETGKHRQGEIRNTGKVRIGSVLGNLPGIYAHIEPGSARIGLSKVHPHFLRAPPNQRGREAVGAGHPLLEPLPSAGPHQIPQEGPHGCRGQFRRKGPAKAMHHPAAHRDQDRATAILPKAEDRSVNDTPIRIVTETVKFGEDRQPPKGMGHLRDSDHILNHDRLRTDLLDDFQRAIEQISLVSRAPALTGLGIWLARKAAGDEIDAFEPTDIDCIHVCFDDGPIRAISPQGRGSLRIPLDNADVAEAGCMQTNRPDGRPAMTSPQMNRACDPQCGRGHGEPWPKNVRLDTSPQTRARRPERAPGGASRAAGHVCQRIDPCDRFRRAILGARLIVEGGKCVCDGT